tara:strand:+ start:4702 stop:4977 length:276 start_codon:yes stop_codon:yes gene_type:complete
MENQNTSNQVNSKTEEQQAEYEALCKVVGNLYLQLINSRNQASEGATATINALSQQVGQLLQQNKGLQEEISSSREALGAGTCLAECGDES